ncbi:MAG: hypothetical protein GXO26_02325 [Crenarchaeota archaeon]|nr:hypothetical protein [Thermoproteota archaeon]
MTVRSVQRRIVRSWDHKAVKSNATNMVTIVKNRCEDRRNVIFYSFLPYVIFNRRLHKSHNVKSILKV